MDHITYRDYEEQARPKVQELHCETSRPLPVLRPPNELPRSVAVLPGRPADLEEVARTEVAGTAPQLGKVRADSAPSSAAASADRTHLDHSACHRTCGAAENSFRDALALADRQGAKLFELRAATGLARLSRDQVWCSEARELLAPVYARFTEGFDAPDLIEAKTLLRELA